MNVVLIVACFFSIAFCIWILPSLFPNRKHRQNRRIAQITLNKIRQANSAPEVYYCLRSTDPFVFEEMILLALKHAGHQVKHNKRYTGDGGIDGRCKINGKKYLIQAKRYRSYVNPKHIDDFDSLCTSNNSRGLFVHTGKTGNKSLKKQYNSLTILSGQRMLDLLIEGKLSSF